MRPASSLDDLCQRPVGRYVAGRSYLLWAASPTLAGAVYFARPTPDEWTDLLRHADVVRHATFRPPLDAVIDAHALDALPVEAFEALADHVRSMRSHAPVLRRVGLVRPRGLVGATLGGLFHDAVRSHYPAALFEDRAQAFAWLERDDALAVAREVSSLVEAVRATPMVLRHLREHLTRDAGSDLRRAARALGIAERTMQRHLRDAGTTFRSEVEGARLAIAERMLLADDAKIDVVARRAGFASASHLSRAFRQRTGETPTEFRRQRRS